MKSGGLQAIFKLFFSPPPAPSLMWMCTCFYWLFKKSSDLVFLCLHICRYNYIRNIIEKQLQCLPEGAKCMWSTYGRAPHTKLSPQLPSRDQENDQESADKSNKYMFHQLSSLSTSHNQSAHSLLFRARVECDHLCDTESHGNTHTFFFFAFLYHEQSTRTNVSCLCFLTFFLVC